MKWPSIILQTHFILVPLDSANELVLPLVIYLRSAMPDQGFLVLGEDSRPPKAVKSMLKIIGEFRILTHHKNVMIKMLPTMQNEGVGVSSN